MLPTTPLLTKALLSLAQRHCNSVSPSSGLTCLSQLVHAASTAPWLPSQLHTNPGLSFDASTSILRHIHTSHIASAQHIDDPLRIPPQYKSHPRLEWYVDPATIHHPPPATVLQMPEGYDVYNPAPEYTIEGQIEGQYKVKLQKVFAVVKVGNKQYKVTPRDLLYIDPIQCDINTKLMLRQVLLLGSPTETVVGRPYIPEATVECIVEEQFLDAKKLVFKKRRRKNSKRLKGFRHPLTAVRIVAIHDAGVLHDGTPQTQVQPQKGDKLMRRY